MNLLNKYKINDFVQSSKSKVKSKKSTAMRTGRSDRVSTSRPVALRTMRTLLHMVHTALGRDSGKPTRQPRKCVLSFAIRIRCSFSSTRHYKIAEKLLVPAKPSLDAHRIALCSNLSLSYRQVPPNDLSMIIIFLALLSKKEGRHLLRNIFKLYRRR